VEWIRIQRKWRCCVYHSSLCRFIIVRRIMYEPYHSLFSIVCSNCGDSELCLILSRWLLLLPSKCDGFYTHILSVYKYFESYQYDKAVIDYSPPNAFCYTRVFLLMCI